MKLLTKLLTLCGILVAATPGFAATPVTYNNLFLAYYTPADITALVNYAQQQNLGGLIEWTLNGDVAYTDKTNSLLNAAVTAYQPQRANPPLIMSYWTDWSVYSAAPDSRAIPEAAYAVPGSSDVNGNPVINQDFTTKLAGVNVIVYSFLEAQGQNYSYNGQTIPNPNPSQIGTLYFSDPWSDLTPTDNFCNANKICSYTTDMQNKPFAASAKMGNFEAFTQLAHSSKTNPLGPLKKVISVGGYGHDASFEQAFDTSAHLQNFVNSAAQILNNYQLDGIDLDYENPDMTALQSQQFLQLVQTLRQTLGANKLITVTTLADPAYLNGTRQGQYGFAKGVLSQLATVANKLNLMTYDFHGAFDYIQQGTGRTGFSTNLFLPTNAPSGYDPQFSVASSVQAALKQGVKSTQIVVGFPTYGRALANISSANTPNNSGLFQLITSTAAIPRGDLDSATCATAIAPLTPDSCSGTFQYNYIVNYMLPKGFTAQDWTQDGSGVANGTTAYASNWTVQTPVIGYTLELTNTGDGSLGDLGIQISIGTATAKRFNATFGPSDYLSPDSTGDKTYTSITNPSTSTINGQSNLTVHWTTWSGGPAGDCPQPLNFTSNMHVMIKVTKTGAGICAYSQLPLLSAKK